MLAGILGGGEEFIHCRKCNKKVVKEYTSDSEDSDGTYYIDCYKCRTTKTCPGCRKTCERRYWTSGKNKGKEIDYCKRCREKTAAQEQKQKQEKKEKKDAAAKEQKARQKKQQRAQEARQRCSMGQHSADVSQSVGTITVSSSDTFSVSGKIKVGGSAGIGKASVGLGAEDVMGRTVGQELAVFRCRHCQMYCLANGKPVQPLEMAGPDHESVEDPCNICVAM